MATDVSDQVDTKSFAYNEMEKYRELPRTLMGGTLAMREARTKYLPDWDKEDPKEYKRRLDQSVLDNFYLEAVEGIADQVFSEDLILSDDATEELQDLWGNIDGQGTSGDIFCRSVSVDSLGQGISHILVDTQIAPESERELLSEEDETALNMRPVWRHFEAHNLIEALPANIGGKLVLQRARYQETFIVDKGEWGSEEKKRVRAYYRGNPDAETDERYAWWQVWDFRDNGWEIAEEGRFIPPINAPEDVKIRFIEIPLIPVYTRMDGFFIGKPQMRTLAELNSSHWRKMSNKDNSLDVASVPAKLFRGFPEDALNFLQWGPLRAIVSSNPQAAVDDISHSPNSVAMSQDDLDRLERRMATTAQEPNMSRASGQELATVKTIDEAKRLSRAGAWALTWISAYNQCLKWTAWWRGYDTEAELNVAPGVLKSMLTEQGFDYVLKMKSLDLPLTDKTILSEAQRYHHLDDTIDLDEEIEEFKKEQEEKPNPMGLLPIAPEDEEEEEEEEVEEEDEGGRTVPPTRPTPFPPKPTGR